MKSNDHNCQYTRRTVEHNLVLLWMIWAAVVSAAVAMSLFCHVLFFIFFIVRAKRKRRKNND